jgi:hypothetical protein
LAACGREITRGVSLPAEETLGGRVVTGETRFVIGSRDDREPGADPTTGLVRNAVRHSRRRSPSALFTRCFR